MSNFNPRIILANENLEKVRASEVYAMREDQFIEMTMSCNPQEALNSLRNIYKAADFQRDVYGMVASMDIGNSIKKQYNLK